MAKIFTKKVKKVSAYIAAFCLLIIMGFESTMFYFQQRKIHNEIELLGEATVALVRLISTRCGFDLENTEH